MLFPELEPNEHCSHMRYVISCAIFWTASLKIDCLTFYEFNVLWAVSIYPKRNYLLISKENLYFNYLSLSMRQLTVTVFRTIDFQLRYP